MGSAQAPGVRTAAEPEKTVAVAWTGASGIGYGLRLVECLLGAGHRVYLLISEAAQVVLKMEAGLAVPSRAREAEVFLADYFARRLAAGSPGPATGASGHTEDGGGPRTPSATLRPGQFSVFGRQQWTAPVASGSNPPDAMVVCPCTTGTLGQIAGGLSGSLIDRAADVALKEGRPLILVVRETPFSIVHLENMLRLARAGAVIMPANPGFYFNPASVDQVIDFMVARVLDRLGVAHRLLPRWGEDGAPQGSGPAEAAAGG